MKTSQPKSSLQCYPDGDLTGIDQSFSKFLGDLGWCKFLQVFRPMQSFKDNILSILPYLWEKYKAGEELDDEALITELAIWIGRERLDEEIMKHPKDFEEVIRILRDFLDSAEKEYYSGFYGYIRWLKEKKKVKSLRRYKKMI